MNVQVMCDHNLKFTDVLVGWPGSVHDARVFNNSSLPDWLDELPREYHVLGDSAYPLSERLLTPYRELPDIAVQERQFNIKHSKTRVDVERSIGLLKVKWRRLKHLDMDVGPLMNSVIMACCLLHNFVLGREEVVEEVEAEIDDGDVHVVGLNIPPRQAAQNKRNEIALALV